jgi:nicotinamide riboside kinase
MTKHSFIKLRLGLSGSAGTGKTTLGMRLASQLDLPFIPEGMRIHLEKGLDLYSLSRSAHKALTLELLSDMLEACACAERDAGGFICDRSPMDSAAFWLYYGLADDDQETAALLDHIAQAAQRFDAVVMVPWGVIPLQADGIRYVNRWAQLHFQSILEGLCQRRLAAQAVWWLPLDVVDIEARVDWILYRTQEMR